MKVMPGPGKYETMDMMGSGKNFYNSKHKTQKQKSFNGGDRFSRSILLFIQPRELQAHPTTQLITQSKLMEIVSCQR